MLTAPLQMLLLAIAGWMNEHQRARNEFLEKQLGVRTRGKRLGHKVLREAAGG